jgi:formylmethanofuran dehydrogenase subunit C
MNKDEIAGIPLWDGNQKLTLGAFFTIARLDPSPADHEPPALQIRSATDRLDRIGAQMDAGTISVEGDAGAYLGQDMSGGEITLTGKCGPFAGSGMRNGLIRIDGDAGDFLGAAIPGERQGLRGGTITVGGNAGDRVGDHQRRGMILIAGNAGAYCGARMVAGTIVVLGKTGAFAGYGMKRGTLLLRQPPDSILPTFNTSGRHDLTFLTLLLNHLHGMGDSWTKLDGSRTRVDRYVGDLAVGGKGEVLIWQ